MSKILGECPTKQCEVPELLFAQDTHLDDLPKHYIVVALSQRKQSQIMGSVGKVHRHDQPFPTWSLLSQVLSKALFAQPDRLRLKSTMELHHKDYLLFEQDSDGRTVNMPGATTAPESILEVDFGKQSDSMIWLGYWRPARPVVVELVRNSLVDLARLSESDSHQHENHDRGNQGLEIQSDEDEAVKL